MEKIEIQNFKAFDSKFELAPGPERRSLLVYGENGSGKSSLFEAIKLIFYRDRLLKPYITKGASLEQRINDEDSFYKNVYAHRKSGLPHAAIPQLALNGVDFKSIARDCYQCYMVSNTDLQYEKYSVADGTIKKQDEISLKYLFSQLFVEEFDITSFVNNRATDLLASVNLALSDHFMEDVELAIDHDDIVLVHDRRLDLSESNGLRNIFNEAKINLIILLLVLCLIKMLEAQMDPIKRKLLVIDDVITSLDAENRSLLVHYLLDSFGDFQVVIFTHNIGFNNLFCRCLELKKLKEKWICENIYITNSGSLHYHYDDLKSPEKIRSDFDSSLLTPGNVGNEIRKRFEADIYELAKLISLDATSLATEIVGNIVHQNHRYFINRRDKKIQDSNTLVGDIVNIYSSVGTSDADKVSQIRQEVEKYSTDADIVKLKEFITEFYFYEKVVLHSLSHGTVGMPSFNQKEVRACTFTLEKIEELIKQLRRNLDTTL